MLFFYDRPSQINRWRETYSTFNKKKIENVDNATKEDFDKSRELWKMKYYATKYGRTKENPNPVQVIHYDGTPFTVDIFKYEDTLAIMKPPFVWRDVATKERLVSPMITSRGLKNQTIYSFDCDYEGNYNNEERVVINRILDQANEKLGFESDVLSRNKIRLEKINCIGHMCEEEDRTHPIPYTVKSDLICPKSMYLVLEIDPLSASKKLGMEFDEYLIKHKGEHVETYVDLFKGTVQAIQSYIEERDKTLEEIARKHLDKFLEF